MKRISILVGGMSVLLILGWFAQGCGDSGTPSADAVSSPWTGDGSMGDAMPAIDMGGAIWYACPMHAEILADYAGAKCPKCGMDLVVAEGTPTLPAGDVWYSCPMHPQIVADFAGTCPICHMALTAATGIDAAVDQASPGMSDGSSGE